MATIKDVAKKAGVSVCTVSRTLSKKGYVKKETRERILEAVAELHYQPNNLAVSLKTGRSNVLALILPSFTNIYYPKLEKYIERFANEKGYMIYLVNAENSLQKEKNILDSICAQNLAGVIITPTTNEHDHIKKLGEYNIPYLYLNRNFQDDPKHCIHIDNEQAAFDAVSYLIEHGHTNIGGVFQSFSNMSYEERLGGMLRAMREHEIPVNENNILFDVAVDTLDTSYVVICEMLKRPDRPEAIFACNDMIAFGVYKAAYDVGLKIPDDLSVFGYDNCIMANMVAPALSTFNTPAKELSRLSIEYIDHYIKTGEHKELPLIKGDLIIRDSVKQKN